jgi:ribonucleotide reductase beta subunit family protein with ferritin-like domain
MNRAAVAGKVNAFGVGGRRSATTENLRTEYAMAAPVTIDMMSDTVTNPLDSVQLRDKAISKRRSREAEEPLLTPNPHRYVLFPIQHDDLWRKYKEHISVFWRPEEVDLSKDMTHWATLTANEQHFIKRILGFFAGSDGIVMENLGQRFAAEVQVPEARQFYAVQMMMESVHCVAPETMLLTDKGHLPIVSLADTTVNVWNGEEFSPVNVVQTSPMDSLVTVNLSNGMSLECTKGHKWFIRQGPETHPERCTVEKVETSALRVGDVVGEYSLPHVDIADPDEFLNPYTHGFFCGDGTYTNKYPSVTLYHEKQALLPYLAVSSINPRPALNRTTCYLTHKVSKEKFFVPVNYSTKTKLEWFAGLLDADGCVKRSKKGFSALQLGSVNKLFLKEIQLMLSTLGIHSNIRKNKDAESRFMPDGKGGVKEYPCAEIWVMYITNAETFKLVQLGITTHRLILVVAPVKANRQLIRVESIIDNGRRSPTYCFTEPKRHAGVFNGILTGQSETYSLLIDQYVEDRTEKVEILRSIQTIPCIQKKAEWAVSWIQSEEADFATRLMAFAAIEGIFFSGAFCSIFWLKQRGLMPGLTVSNEFIARDEGLHTDFACLMYSKCRHRLPKTKAYRLIREAVRIEKEFITEALPCSLVGMSAPRMADYIEFVADRLLISLGYERLWNTANPFPWMERISLEGKDNFFEKRVTNYALAGVGADATKMTFALDEEF